MYVKANFIQAFNYNDENIASIHGHLYLFCTYYPSSSKNFATTFGAILSLKSSFMVCGNESNARTSAGQCSCPNLIQSTLPGLNRLSEDVFAIFNDEHVKEKINMVCRSTSSYCFSLKSCR